MKFQGFSKKKNGFTPHLSQDTQSNNLNHRNRIFNYGKKGAGFIVFLLDFLFVAVGVIVLIISLAERQWLVAAVAEIFRAGR